VRAAQENEMPDREPGASSGRANEDLLERFYAAIEQDRLEVVERLVDERVVIRLAGRHELAGTYRGREAAMRFYRRVAGVLGPGFRFPAHDVLADEQSIVVLPKAAAWRTAERGMDVYHVVDGRITEIWLTEWHLDDPGE
jgi:ketosteroid isomerase-like protein